MSSAKLKEDLKNCLITFDRRVVLTELLDDYDLPYEVVNAVIIEHLKHQENKSDLKYEKRYLVHGVQNQGESKREIFKIVEEPKLQEWLGKLKNAESSLYSVEVAGGAKAAAHVFKPLKVKGVPIKERKCITATSDINGTVIETSKNNISKEKEENPANTQNKSTPKSTNKPPTPVKKTSPKIESSPTTKKTLDKKAAASKKGGISNFFSTAASKKTDSDTKDHKTTVKPPTPKKLQDFFKKQTETLKPNAESVSQTANKSLQLFEAEEEVKDEPAEVSSDEEEKIEALKRDIISSDVEMDADEESDKPMTSAKRRRILDSDDEEEDPPVKHEKLEAEETKEEVVVEPEVYLDEEGFVITKKPKQKPAVVKTSATKTTPAVTLKTPSKENKRAMTSTSKDSKGTGKTSAKTKQAGIMSFFSKK